uniref:Growth-regulating factor n=1 Tax=Elaeophora elaphi TaxID=1147741 RepID=A0A0R3RUA1_9BILA
MESSQWTGNNTLQLKDRFKHIICVIVQLYKVEGNNWRELTKDFVLMHMYYDQETQEVSRRCCIKVALRLSRKLTCQASITSLFTGRRKNSCTLLAPNKEGRRCMVLDSSISTRLSSSSDCSSSCKKDCICHPEPQFKVDLNTTVDISRFYPQYRNRHICLLSPHQAVQFSAPNRDAHITPLFSLNDSSWRNVVSQGDVTVDVQQIEKELQGLSLVSDASVTAPNFNSAPSVSRQTSVDAASSFHLDSNPYVPLSAEQQQYQLWSTSPWNNFLEQPVYNNQASITSTWDSLLNRESKNASEV